MSEHQAMKTKMEAWRKTPHILDVWIRCTFTLRSFNPKKTTRYPFNRMAPKVWKRKEKKKGTSASGGNQIWSSSPLPVAFTGWAICSILEHANMSDLWDRQSSIITALVPEKQNFGDLSGKWASFLLTPYAVLSQSSIYNNLVNMIIIIIVYCYCCDEVRLVSVELGF